MPKKIAVFASGTGTNANAIIEFFKMDASADVALVVSSRHDAGVLDVAERHDVPWVVLDSDTMKDEEVLLGMLEAYEIDLIVLAGWLKLIPSFLVAAFEHRIVNIHPALLPKYGGKGMWGKHVHQAVKASGDTKSGVTIHEVSEAYDEGRVIAQFEVSLEKGESAESIEQKVRALELSHYPEVIKKYMHS